MHEPDLFVTTAADDLAPPVRAVNDLTARWCSQFRDEDCVVSGAGVWPLLALLASAADEAARNELAAALGRPADSARAEGLEVLDALREGMSTSAAVGVWTHDAAPLIEDWASRLPAGVTGRLTGQEALDKWAADGTGGLIDRFPLEIDDEVRLVIASVIAAKTRWLEPFRGSSRGCDPLSDDAQPTWLERQTDDPSVAAVLDNSVTRVVVEGDGDLDVHLLLGDQTRGTCWTPAYANCPAIAMFNRPSTSTLTRRA
ncbi:serpin family protein [Gordonia sp. GN26]